MRLREKIKKWLFEEDFKKLEQLSEELQSVKMILWETEKLIKPAALNYDNAKTCHDNSIKLLENAEKSYRVAETLAEDCKKLMNSVCDVGVDVGFHGDDHSWAVVCIQGKPEYVKFVPLGHNDARDVLHFLKRFQYSNRVIDSPFGYRDFVEKYMVK